MLSFADRGKLCTNSTAKQLCEIIETKQSNLALSADVTTQKELLKLVDQVGPYICVLKTHIDIISDFDTKLTQQLTALAKKHNFIIFEDRKFADIGNTVNHQYSGGIYHIADWAPITNAHSVPGPGIIEGLKKVGLAKGNGLLLLAEMSSAGSLAHGHYTEETVNMAKAHSDFVIGFIARRKLTKDPTFIHMTPGVQFHQQTDALGQQYITPEQAIIENSTDIIIVGRGIYEAKDPAHEAKRYQEAGWQAYLQRAR